MGALGPGAGPLWRRLQDDVRRRITAGEFSDGFPGELALAAEYDVSRHTVREALRELRGEGLVSAARGRSPRVAEDGVLHQPLGALYSLFRSVESSGRRQTSVVRALEVVTDPEVAARLGRSPRLELLHLARVRLADGDPLAVDDAWVPAARTRALLEVDFTHTALYDELRTRCGITISGGSEQISAGLADAATREALDLPDPSAVVEVERVGLVDGRPFEVRRTLVRGDRFVLGAEFSARDGYQLAR
ncbi:GntR family transcriptional regulator [Aquipuribacter nitratireducens]|uniref:GntR family transcriptional regulator n=1 Tax=Aquipuribacter nitratireducens TaxID=650104 RepID=A0ABW0GLC3_9MICO